MPLILDDVDAADFYTRFSARVGSSQNEAASFVRDPVGYILKTVGLRTGSNLGRRLAALPNSQISQANAFLMTLLANPGFVDWMREYSSRTAAQIVSTDMATPEGQALKRQTMEDLARAMIDHGELRLFMDMVRAGGDRSIAETIDTDALVGVEAWYDGVAVDVEIFIYAVVAAAAFGVITVAVFQFDLSIPVGVPAQARTAMTANEVRNLSQQLLEEAQRLYGRTGQ